MLFGLRHPAVVRGHHQQSEINRAGAGDHMSNKIFVARDIDNADVEALFVRRVQNEVGETELNRNSARLFLRQSVWIGARERFDESAFSMINVTRRCENKMFFCHFVATQDTNGTKS